MHNISLLVGLKNNLEYTKNFYNTTRSLYPDIEICFASYDSTDGTNEWLDEKFLSDHNLKYFYSVEKGTFSDTFNRCAELATKDYIVFLHNDIVLAEGFVESLMDRLDQKTVLSYTTVEPPIFEGHERPGKIIKDFGVDIQSFKADDFAVFAKEKRNEYRLSISVGVSFFMALSRNVYLKMGGMDNLFNPCFSEDDDLINRLSLQKMNLITCLDAICYHFVSKTSRFSEEFSSKTAKIEKESNRNFFRKWGGRTHSSRLGRYNVGIRIKNCTFEMLQILEPTGDNIYVDLGQEAIEKYIANEQPKTKYNLSKKILNYNDRCVNDYLVDFDGASLNNENIQVLSQIQNILKTIKQEGRYQVDIFVVQCFNVRSFEDQLINISDYDKDLFIL